MAILLGGALTGVLALCAIAGLFILKNANSGPQRIGPARSAQNGTARPKDSFTPFDVVPAACDIIQQDLASRLVPGSQSQADEAAETDSDTKCNWGDLAASDPRALTVELRGINGADPVEAAKGVYQQEATADESGKNLLTGQRLKYFQPLEDVGDQAYEMFVVDRIQSQGLVNARVGNVMITVGYGGRANEDTPLDQAKCLDGATEVAKAAAEAVRQAAG